MKRNCMIVNLERSYPSIYGLPVVNKIDTLVFSVTYPASGCESSCRDACCSGGATMDMRAFKALVTHRSAQRFASIPWEGYDFTEDRYSPGGKGCYTRFDGGRCMFQNEDWGCSIHSYCAEEGLDVHELKFFTCCLFPVEVNRIGDVHDVLTAGYEMRHPQYDLPCKRNGDTPVYDVAKRDIEYYYGAELIREIEALRLKCAREPGGGRSGACEGSL